MIFHNNFNKYKTICRRLSHNRLKHKYYSTASSDYYPTSRKNASSPSHEDSSANLFTECTKCKLNMSTYDYLLHNCMKNQNENSNKPDYSPLNHNYRHNFKSSDVYNRKSFSSVNNKNSTPTTSKSQHNLNSSKSFTRNSYDPVNSSTTSSSSGLGASFSSNTSNISPKQKPNINFNSIPSDFVYSTKPNTAFETFSHADNIANSGKEKTPNKTIPAGKISSAQKKSFNIPTDFKSDPLYTPLIKTPSTTHNQEKPNKSNFERSKSQLKQTPITTTPSSSMSFSSPFTKPFSSESTPSYSKYSRLSNLDGGITNILNSSHTGLKRAKLRTGF
jgi:hypothetical protein